MNCAYLQRLPGLMGDEASEGENVYELLHADHITITGERSYIGPAIDYLRVPFVAVFGYTALAVRVPMLLFSLVTFWLAWYCLRRTMGETPSLYGLTGLVFSPIFIAHQRLGWTISLFPFCLFLLWALWLWWQGNRQSYLPAVIGLVAGLSLANHILFLPSLVAAVVVGGLLSLRRWRTLLAAWPALIGFWAGFGMQFAVMLFMKEDQGDAGANAGLVSQRLHDLPHAWPLFVSGSSYVAHYTGVEFSPLVILVVTAMLVFLAVCSWLGIKRSRTVAWLWLWALIYWPVLLLMIDRFSLRYFVVGCLWVWMMAGIGLFELCRLAKVPERFQQIVPVGLALMLSIWAALVLFIPYLRNGGSTANFDLGNREDSASALVDVRPLISCLAGRGPLFSENIHIFNRLQYLSHSDERLQVVTEDHKKEAKILVLYRLPADEGKSRDKELCPDLTHFRVVTR